VAVIKKLIKQHKDSIEQFTAAGRVDLVTREARELEILKGYMPAEMGEEEISKIIEDAVTSTGASGIKDMGNVMKDVRAKIGGGADGKLVSELVRRRLSKQEG